MNLSDLAGYCSDWTGECSCKICTTTGNSFEEKFNKIFWKEDEL